MIGEGFHVSSEKALEKAVFESVYIVKSLKIV